MRTQRRAFLGAGLPVISVDTKKKELIGNFKRQGRVWCRHPTEVDSYDFASQAECVVLSWCGEPEALAYPVVEVSYKKQSILGQPRLGQTFA